MPTLFDAYALLTGSERRRATGVCVVVIGMAAFEVVGVSSIVPFLKVLADPDAIRTNEWLAFAFERLSFESTQSFLRFLGIAAFVLLLLSALVRSGGYYVLYHFTQMLRHSIGSRLLETYLRQPYEFFLDHHSGDLAKAILSEVDHLGTYVYQPAANLVASVFTLVAISGLLVFIDPTLAVSAAGLLAGAYGVIFLTVKRRLEVLGAARLEANRERFEATSEALGGFKEIRLLGREAAYLKKFQGPSLSVSRVSARANTMGQIPKFMVEALAFGGILLLAVALVGRQTEQEENLGTLLPMMGLYALAGYRMLPAVQGIYHASTQLKFGAPSVQAVVRDLNRGRDAPPLAVDPASPMGVREKLELRALNYVYPGSDTAGVHDVDLELSAGSTLGIVGTTGAGKTTLVDLILGLLSPTSGQILVDSLPIEGVNLRAWQASIGYVPQEIFLVEGSIASNIALGVSERELDSARVRECARMAQLLDFVEGELTEGFATRVGERGVRLSGGQRQRIGIARSLYRDPDFIVFDEATSALDNHTENALMSAVRELRGTKTIVMIAHRLSTLQSCDQIVVMDGGRVVGRGTFAELERTNEVFRKIARSTHLTK